MPSIFERDCLRCGKHYRGMGRKFCSDTCRHKASSRRIEFDCKNCGKHCDRPASHATYHATEFCSRKCWYAFATGRGLTAKPEHRAIKITCKSCGKEKWIPPSQKRPANYCSRRCINLGRPSYKRTPDSERIHLRCVMCGRDFSKLACQNINGRSKCCSRTCTAYYSLSVQGGNKRTSTIEDAFFDECLAAGAMLRRQVSVGPYCVDALSIDGRTAIEFDGDYWHRSEQAQRKDRRKDGYLKKQGLRVVRIPERLYRSSASHAISIVLEAIR